jgi:hypothetical protein
LATAGSEATSAFAADVNEMATQLIMAGAQEAYSSMWEACQSGAGCPSVLASTELGEKRLRLATAVRARARALEALGKAYQALAKEAEYDGAADLRGATGEAIEGANAFTSAVAAAGGPVVPAISATVGTVAGGMAGIIGEQRQRNRIIEGNRRIAAAVEGLRDGLRAEAAVFDTLADYLGNIRSSLRVALIEGGLISRAEFLKPLASSVGAQPGSGAETILGSNAAARRALEEAVRAGAAAEIQQARTRYALAVQALTSLLNAHRQLAANQAVGLADVHRLVGHFIAALEAQQAKEEGE